MCEATNHFLSDCDCVEKASAHQPNDCDMTTAGQAGEQEIDRQGTQDNAVANNGQDTSKTQLTQEEELEYGYDLIGNNDHDSSGWVDNNDDMEFLNGDNDMLEAKDDEGSYGDAGDLGFGDL